MICRPLSSVLRVAQGIGLVLPSPDGVSVSVVVTVVCLTAHQFRCQFRCQFQQVQLGDGTTLDVHGGSQQAGVVGVPQLVVPRFQLGVDRCLVQCFPGAARMHPGVCVKGSSLSDQPISISVPAKLSGRYTTSAPTSPPMSSISGPPCTPAFSPTLLLADPRIRGPFRSNEARACRIGTPRIAAAHPRERPRARAPRARSDQ